MKLIRSYGIDKLVEASKNKKSGRIYVIGYDKRLGIMLGCTFNEKYYTFAIYNVAFMSKEQCVEMRFGRNQIDDGIEEICEKVIECYNSIYA